MENTSSGSTFSEGSGTEDDPYIIASAADFIQLATDVNGGETYQGTYFKVSDDATDPIVLSSTEGFSPIGTESNKFNGTFDGNDKTVELDLELSEMSDVGLFGYCDSKSVIKNVTTTGTVAGSVDIGGIAGRTAGNVINCRNEAVVTGENVVGGIAGRTAGNVINCHNEAAVTGNDSVGGIVGCSGDYVINCSNSGKVSGSAYVGGIVGDLGYTYAINCLNTGSVEGDTETGGIAGNALNVEITNCVNNGKVSKKTESGKPVGGIAGRLQSSVTITNCYYNQTQNAGVCDAGYDYDNSSVTITTTDCAVSGNDIVSDTVLDKLNIYADKNKPKDTALLYWKADGDAISLTSEKPTLPYTITNNSSAYITVDSCARKDATVTITVKASYFAVTGVTVKDADNAEVAVTQTATGYTFTMPESDVTVSATADIKLNQEGGVYQITSAEEMKILSDAVNNGYDTTNKSFLLTSDVSLSTEGGFAPIGVLGKLFEG
ncbi:MAG: hypothetical protein ACI4RF_06195, partial [Eubacterium sp.]